MEASKDGSQRGLVSADLSSSSCWYTLATALEPAVWVSTFQALPSVLYPSPEAPEVPDIVIMPSSGWNVMMYLPWAAVFLAVAISSSAVFGTVMPSFSNSLAL